MALNTNQQQNDDILDIKKQSLYARLKTLFSSDTIVRNVGGKKLIVKDVDHSQMATDRNSLRDRFNRIRSTAYNAYTRDFTLSYQAARMDLFRDYDCIAGETIIPLPDGTYPTIAELTEKYKDSPQERFHVFSYDHESDSMKLGNAYHPRKKEGKRVGWKVIFDDGKFVIGSEGHPFLMRNGEYKVIKDLKVGESVMPFYQSEYGYKNHGFKRYRKVYNFSRGWQTEHKIITEQFQRKLETNEVIHHKDFNGSNNSADNLQIMNWKDHKEFHSNHSKNVLWGADNYDVQLEKLTSHPNYINRKFATWDGKREGENNPFYGKTHTVESNIRRSNTLKELLKDRIQTDDKNPNYRGDLTFDTLKIKAIEFYKTTGNIRIDTFAQYLGCDKSVITNRVSKHNITWNIFKKEIVSTLNHKISAIECVGEIDVYDVTVEKYQNFATNSVFCHNTMDMDPILSSALDIYSDEIVNINELGKTVTVHCEDNNIKEILYNLYEEILHVDFNLWSWTRNLVKYGDFYLKTYVNPEYGVYMVEPISTYNVERIENSDPYNKKYVKFQIRPTDTSQAEVLEKYQMSHFRLLSDSNFIPYGKSVIEGARRVWKQLSLLEDSMLIHRVVRAPERRIYSVDIGGIPPAEVDNYMQKLMDKMKKVPYMDERTGEYNLKYNLQNMLDDIYLPVRGSDSGTKIDTLPGMEWTGIDDIDYIKNKMFAALKIPKAFLTYDEATGAKSTLSAEDLRFAKTIQRIQKLIASELENIGIIHLYAQGYRDESLIDFKVELTNSSTIFEKEKLEIWSDKTNLATDMIDNKIHNREWIYRNVFRMSDDDIEKNTKGLVEDAKLKFRLESIEAEGDDPAKPFKKIGAGGGHGDKESSGGGGGGHGGGVGMGGLGGLGGGGDEEGEDEEGKPEDEKGEANKQGIPSSEEPDAAGEGKPEDIVKEEHSPDRDQSGEHDANDHPFGEDPLGQNELNRKPRKNSEGKRKSVLYHNFENDSPLSLEEVKSQLKPKPSNKKNKGEFIMGLREFFDPTPSTIIAENIMEVTSSVTIEENVKE